MRVFFALWPDADTRKALADVAESLLAGRAARRVPPANYHLTLYFLGEVADERLPALIEAAQGLAPRPHTLEFDRGGYFRKAGVAWLGPSHVPAALRDFQAGLVQRITQLEFAAPARGFRPHLTIARACPRRLPAPKGMRVQWPVEDFVLCASRGARYEILARYGARYGPRDG